MPKGLLSICGAAAVMLALAPAQAQQPAAKPGSSDAGLPVGPATVAPHWSKYDYPKSVPEGAPYHVIERGDTLWDLSSRYLGSPYLWPQIWNENKYVTDAHWIYPGDPLVMPKVALISDQAGAHSAGSSARCWLTCSMPTAPPRTLQRSTRASPAIMTPSRVRPHPTDRLTP